MDIAAYIQSGAIESYVLGLASEAEQQELELLCDQHPEIVKARLQFEQALESRLMKDAVAPPAAARENILSALAIADDDFLYTEKPAAPAAVRNINGWKWLAAACLIAVAGTVIWIYSLTGKYSQLRIINAELTSRLDHSNHTDALLALKPVIAKPSVVWSTMLEPKNTAHCAAHIYWDTLSANTYLLLGNIPPPLTGKQFQLWAITAKRPVSLGTFDISKEGQLIQMKNVRNAQVFMITLEPRGGSAAPTTNAAYAVSREL